LIFALNIVSFIVLFEMSSFSSLLNVLSSMLFHQTPFENGFVGFYYGSCQVYTNANFRGMSRNMMLMNMFLNGLIYGLIEFYFDRIWLLMLIHLIYTFDQRQRGHLVIAPVLMFTKITDNGNQRENDQRENDQLVDKLVTSMDKVQTSLHEIGMKSTIDLGSHPPPNQAIKNVSEKMAHPTGYPRYSTFGCPPTVPYINETSSSDEESDEVVTPKKA